MILSFGLDKTFLASLFNWTVVGQKGEILSYQSFMVVEWREMTVVLGITARREKSQAQFYGRSRQCGRPVGA